MRLVISVGFFGLGGCTGPAAPALPLEPSAEVVPAAAAPLAYTLTPHSPTGVQGTPEALPAVTNVNAWRVALADLDEDGTEDAIFAGGGDQLAQLVVARQGNPAAGFAPSGYVQRFQAGAAADGPSGPDTLGPAWGSEDLGYNSQLRVANLAGDARPELVVSTYYRDSHSPNSVNTEVTGVRYYVPSTAPNADRMPPHWLLTGVEVNDFSVVDVNQDGLLDLAVAAAATEAKPGAPAAAAGDRGTGSFLGIYLNRGTAVTPDFPEAPDWWMAFEGNPGGIPSRLTVFDFNQDGWFDYAAAFTSRATAVIYGGRDLSALPPSGARLQLGEPIAGTWLGPASPKMTADSVAMLLGPDGTVPTASGKGLQAGDFHAFLVEARGCYSGHTDCTDCGVNRAAKQGCAAGSPDCESCPAGYTEGEIVRWQLPEPSGDPLLLDLGGMPPLSLEPIDVGSDASLATAGVAMGVGRVTPAGALVTELHATRVGPGKGVDTVPLPGSYFALDLVALPARRGESPARAPQRLLRAAHPGAPALGNVVTLPGVVAPSVTRVVVAGADWPACQNPGDSRCWRPFPEASALVLYPEASPIGDVEVSFSPHLGGDLLVANPDSVTASGVLWRE